MGWASPPRKGNGVGVKKKQTDGMKPQTSREEKEYCNLPKGSFRSMYGLDILSFYDSKLFVNKVVSLYHLYKYDWL